MSLSIILNIKLKQGVFNYIILQYLNTQNKVQVKKQRLILRPLELQFFFKLYPEFGHSKGL